MDLPPPWWWVRGMHSHLLYSGKSNYLIAVFTKSVKEIISKKNSPSYDYALFTVCFSINAKVRKNFKIYCD
eukprot:UN26676